MTSPALQDGLQTADNPVDPLRNARIGSVVPYELPTGGASSASGADGASPPTSSGPRGNGGGNDAPTQSLQINEGSTGQPRVVVGEKCLIAANS